MTLAGSWLFCIQYLSCSESVLVHAWRFEQRTFYFESFRVKLILACQEVLNSITTSNYAPQVEKNCGYCILNNLWKIMGDQLLPKSCVELQDDFITDYFFPLVVHAQRQYLTLNGEKPISVH